MPSITAVQQAVNGGGVHREYRAVVKSAETATNVQQNISLALSVTTLCGRLAGPDGVSHLPSGNNAKCVDSTALSGGECPRGRQAVGLGVEGDSLGSHIGASGRLVLALDSERDELGFDRESRLQHSFFLLACAGSQRSVWNTSL